MLSYLKTISKTICFLCLANFSLQADPSIYNSLSCTEVEAVLDSIFDNELMETAETRRITPSLYQFAIEQNCECNGKVLVLAGIIYRNDAKYIKAKDCMDAADSIFQDQKHIGIAAVYPKLIKGLIELNSGNDDLAIILFERARELSRDIEYGSGELQSQINQALVYNKKDSTEQAKEHLLQAKEIIHKSENKEIPGYVFLNLGNIYIKENNFIAAKENFAQAESIWLQNNFSKGLFFLEYNYAFLAYQMNNFLEYERRLKQAITILERDRAINTVSIYQEIGAYYTKNGRDEEAIKYLQKGINISDGTEENEFLNLATNLFVLYAKNNNEEKINEVGKKLLDTYKIKQEKINEKASKWNKKEFILESKILENKVLKEQKAEAEYKIWLRNLLLYASIGIILLIGILVYQWTKAKNLANKLKMEKIRTKLSQDLHDDVGTTLASISFQAELLEVNLNEDQLKVAQNIRKGAQEVLSNMSDLVWAIDVRKNQPIDLEYKMKEYLASIFDHEDRYYTFSNTVSDKIEGLTPEVKHSIYLIFKETVYNFLKHSDGHNLQIKLSYEDKKLHMNIQDNGNQKDQKKSGQGLQNMKQRAEELGASFNFDYHKGYRTRLSVPLKN